MKTPELGYDFNMVRLNGGYEMVATAKDPMAMSEHLAACSAQLTQKIRDGEERAMLAMMPTDALTRLNFMTEAELDRRSK